MSIRSLERLNQKAASASLDDLDDIDTDNLVTLEDVIENYLAVNPDPSDLQVHQLAVLLGLSVPELEEKFFSMFGAEVQENFTEEDLDLDDDEEDDVDPLKYFVLSYFLHNGEPSEEQIHHLASLLKVTPEELEETIYEMLTDLIDEPSTSD